MRLVLQRVQSARVSVRETTVGQIEAGSVVFVGIAAGDGAHDVDQAVNKVSNLRMFSDGAGKFNLSVQDIGGSLLIVSQFTLLGDCRKGRRPNFSGAAEPVEAKSLYEQFIASLRASTQLKVEAGEFQAHMAVELVNDGPVTMLIDTAKAF